MGDGPVLEPEVLPPEEATAPGGSRDSVARRAPGERRSYLPLLTGLLLDLLDALTAGPIGLATGLLVGGGAVYFITTLHGLPVKQRLLLALAAGIYCTIPGTAPFPLGTLVGAYLNFRR